MRISDWSSDVCSSDLLREPRLVDRAVGFDMVHRILKGIAVRHDAVVDFLPLKYALEHLHDERGRTILEMAVAGVERRQIGRASCRERGCQYVWISWVAVSLKKT